jgi:cytochrome c biogenesis protein CcmG, thiol:disulfide interchange protein DsbE
MAEALTGARSRRGHRVLWTAVTAGALLAAWTLVFLRADPSAPGAAVRRGVPIAQDRPAPAFTRPILGGSGSLSLAADRGSVVVVNFWASWCRACRSEAPSLAALSRDFSAKDVRFVGVDYEDRSEAAMTAARGSGLPYPSVVDPQGTLGDAFRIFGLPMTYIIGPDQRIHYLVAGRIDPASFRAALGSVVSAASSGSG